MTLFFKLSLLLLPTFIESRLITVYNKCPFTVWPGILGPGNPAQGGFRLDPAQQRSFDVDDSWTGGRIWARTGCDENFNCETGFCKNFEQCNGASGVPPASIAEFSLKAYGGRDFYDVYLVDGFNIPVSIIPVGPGCKSAGGCVKDVNAECPTALAVIGRNGKVVACKSACLEFQTDQECCRGAYGTPDKCKRSSTSQMFKDACPTAYTYEFDDETSSFTCSASSTYTVQFC